MKKKGIYLLLSNFSARQGKNRSVPILFGTQFAWLERSYRKVREKATVIESVGYAGWPLVSVEVTDGKRGG